MIAFINAVILVVGWVAIATVCLGIAMALVILMSLAIKRSFQLWKLIIRANGFHGGKAIRARYQKRPFPKIRLFFRILMLDGLYLATMGPGESYSNAYWYFSVEERFVRGLAA